MAAQQEPTAGIEMSLHIGQRVRHRDYKAQRVTGVVRVLAVEDRELMVDIVLDAPIVIPADGEFAASNIYRQYVPAHELAPFDDRDELLAELLAACKALLANAEAGLTNLGAMRAAQAAIAKAEGSAS